MSEVETDWAKLTDPPAEPGEFSATLKGRQCKHEENGVRCPNLIPDAAAPAQKFCNELHFRGNGGRAARRRKGQTGEKPPKLVVEVGGKRPTGGAKDQRARDTAAGAQAFMGVVATGLSMAGDNVCASAVAGGSEQWGAAVGELSKYQPWLASFFAPVGGESQLGAWLGFVMTTGAIVLPVLAHHELLPASVGARLGGVMVAASDTATDVAHQQPAA